LLEVDFSIATKVQCIGHLVSPKLRRKRNFCFLASSVTNLAYDFSYAKRFQNTFVSVD
jgi:hypothetical protein